MYRDPRDGARLLKVLEMTCDVVDEMNRIGVRAEERQRWLQELESESKKERDLFNLVVYYGQATLKAAVQEYGFDEPTFLRMTYDHLHVHVNDPEKEELKPEAKELFEELFSDAGLNMSELRSARADELAQVEIDAHFQRDQARQLAEMMAEMSAKEAAEEAEEVAEVGRALAGAIAEAEAEGDDITELDSSEDGREKTPEEVKEKVGRAVAFSSFVGAVTATTRPRTSSDSSDDLEEQSSFWQKASNRRSMSAMVSPDLQPKTKRARTDEVGEVEVGVAALKNDADYE